MANTIKYSGTNETKALNKGNWYIGVGDVDKGPTETTGFYAAGTPPVGGYTIYTIRPDGIPSMFVANNDQELIILTNQISYSGFTTVAECLNYFATQDDKMVVNKDINSAHTDGLMVYLDPRQTISYPRTGNTWYNLSINQGNNNLTLYGGPTYNNEVIRFDGTDDYGDTNPLPIVNELSFEIWFKRKGDGGSPYNRLWQRSGGHSGYATIGIETSQYPNDYGVVDGKIIGSYSADLGDYFNGSLNPFLNDTWHCYGGTIDSNNVLRSYNLGGLVSENQLTGPIKQSDQNISLCIGDNRRFNGEIGLFRFYNKTLSSDEMKKNYLSEINYFILGDENVVQKEQIFYIDAKYPQSYGLLNPLNNDVFDLSGENQFVDRIGAVERIDNGDGSYFSFDGTDDELKSNDYFRHSSTGPLSIEVWVKYNIVGSLVYGGIVNTGNVLCDGCVGGFGLFFFDNNRITLRLDKTGLGNLNSLNYISSVSLIDDQFHHIVAQRTETDLEIFLDGTLVATTTSTNVEITLDQALRIGNYNSYSGAMDIAMLKIYEDYLSPSEVLQNYNAQKSRFGL